MRSTPKPRKRKPRTVTVTAWAVVEGRRVKYVESTRGAARYLRNYYNRGVVIKLTGKIEL